MNQPTEPIEPDAGREPASLLGRFMNVFAAPGEAFDDIKAAPTRHANWAIPLALSCVVAVAYVVVMFSQPRILQQVGDQQEAALQKQVDAGKMTEDQKERALEQIQRFMKPGFMMITGSFGAVVVSVVMFFGVALGIWLLGRFFFQPPFAYSKAMEVAGLASLIAVLGGLVSMLLMVITGQMQATLSPALFLSKFDPSNRAHACLAALSVFSIWYFAVLSIGLAKISNHSFAKAATWVFLVWVILKFGGIFLMTAWS